MGLADRTPPTAEEYEQYRTRYCNWGRWGADDEMGTLNHITDDVRRGAAGLVTEGRTVSMGRPVDTMAGPANPYPAHHFIGTEGSGGMADYIGMFIHGYTQTHIDALCHLAAHDGGTNWNGKPVGALHMPQGHVGTIDHWREGIVTRGVLYDIPRLRDTDHVVPGAPVHGWELEDAAAAQGVEPRPGDAVIIRSGFDRYYAAIGQSPIFGNPAGVHASCIEYLYDTDASLLCWDMQDAPIEDQGIPNPLPIHIGLHVHMVVIPYMGMPIVDNANLEPLADACAELGRWEFQFVVAPLVLPGGTGSPVNPLAVL